MTDSQLIRIIIADDHRGVRNALTIMLENYDDIQVVGEGTNGKEAVALCERHQPHLILMDLVMPLMDGATATRLIRERFPGICVLILTSGIDPDLITTALEAGAHSYLEKNVTIDTLINAIRSAVQP